MYVSSVRKTYNFSTRRLVSRIRSRGYTTRDQQKVGIKLWHYLVVMNINIPIAF